MATWVLPPRHSSPFFRALVTLPCIGTRAIPSESSAYQDSHQATIATWNWNEIVLIVIAAINSLSI